MPRIGIFDGDGYGPTCEEPLDWAAYVPVSTSMGNVRASEIFVLTKTTLKALDVLKKICMWPLLTPCAGVQRLDYKPILRSQSILEKH